MDFIHNSACGIRAQRAGAGTYRIQKNRVIQRFSLFAGGKHGRNGSLIQRADVDVQSRADGGDFRRFLRFVRHNWAGAAGEDDVGHIVDGYIVGDIVYQSTPLPEPIKTILEHFTSPFMMNDRIKHKRLRHMLTQPFKSISLRWHYPNQVKGLSRSLLSARIGLPVVRYSVIPLSLYSPGAKKQG